MQLDFRIDDVVGFVKMPVFRCLSACYIPGTVPCTVVSNTEENTGPS